MQAYEFFLPCAKGVQNLLSDEIKSFDLEVVRTAASGITIKASVKTAMSLCLWSRVANKVLFHVATVDATSNQSLYDAARAITWDWYLNPDNTLLIQGHGQNRALKNSHYAALRLKDAVCDLFMDRFGSRPNIDKDNPEVQLHLFIRGNKADIYFDFSGPSLHKRGYRQGKTIAPLKESLAASLLYRAGWPEIARAGGHFIDPLCGSGTLVIEAAMMACDIAPNLMRKRFGFHSWKQFDESLWLPIVKEAERRKQQGIAAFKGSLQGFDKHMPSLQEGLKSLETLGLTESAQFNCQPLHEFVYPDSGPGLVLTNPPYGQRLGTERSLKALYQTMKDKLMTRPDDWQLGVFTADREFTRQQTVKSNKNYSFYNGRLHSQLYLYR